MSTRVGQKLGFSLESDSNRGPPDPLLDGLTTKPQLNDMNSWTVSKLLSFRPLLGCSNVLFLNEREGVNFRVSMLTNVFLLDELLFLFLSLSLSPSFSHSLSLTLSHTLSLSFVRELFAQSFQLGGLCLVAFGFFYSFPLALKFELYLNAMGSHPWIVLARISAI